MIVIKIQKHVVGVGTDLVDIAALLQPHPAGPGLGGPLRAREVDQVELTLHDLLACTQQSDLPRLLCPPLPSSSSSSVMVSSSDSRLLLSIRSRKIVWDRELLSFMLVEPTFRDFSPSFM